jgi:hypothetical protein
MANPFKDYLLQPKKLPRRQPTLPDIPQIFNRQPTSKTRSVLHQKYPRRKNYHGQTLEKTLHRFRPSGLCLYLREVRILFAHYLRYRRHSCPHLMTPIPRRKIHLITRMKSLS